MKQPKDYDPSILRGQVACWFTLFILAIGSGLFENGAIFMLMFLLMLFPCTIALLVEILTFADME